MPNCPECNFPYEEGQRFCNTCGTKLPAFIKQKVCPVCGNTLLENTKVCNICGTAVNAPQDTTAAEELARQKEALANPTMDEIEIPVITDDMLGLNEEVPQSDDMPTMDSIYMPGQEPPKKPKPVSINKPAAPEPAVQPSVVSPMQTPNVAPTPQVQQTYQQPQNQYQQTNQGMQQNMYAQTNMPAQNAAPQAVITPEGVNYQQPQQPQMQQNMAYQQNGMPANNMPQQNFPQNGANVQSGKAGKGLGDILPIILIAGIVLVILIDVFVLFRKQIFGDKSSTNAAVITVEDTTGYFLG